MKEYTFAMFENVPKASIEKDLKRLQKKKLQEVKTARPLVDLVNYYGLSPKQMVEIMGIIKRTCPTFSIR